MAVYKRTYRAYSGPITPTWSRFLTLYRFAKLSLFGSKLQTIFFVICFFYPLLCALGIYANAHMSALSLLTKRSGPLLEINGSFFFTFLSVQSTFALLLTTFLGPGLVSPDLANGALTLYLCRPLARGEYVLGKMSVLVILLSAITWVPGLLVFLAQAGVAGGRWWIDNAWIAAAILGVSLLWILVLSLLSLALSAWVKWRVVAGALLLATFFIGAGFGQAINSVLNTENGFFLNIAYLLETVAHQLFRDGVSQRISVTKASIILLLFAGCCLWLLMRKIRPNEVVE